MPNMFISWHNDVYIAYMQPCTTMMFMENNDTAPSFVDVFPFRNIFLSLKKK